MTKTGRHLVNSRRVMVQLFTLLSIFFSESPQYVLGQSEIQTRSIALATKWFESIMPSDFPNHDYVSVRVFVASQNENLDIGGFDNGLLISEDESSFRIFSDQFLFRTYLKRTYDHNSPRQLTAEYKKVPTAEILDDFDAQYVKRTSARNRETGTLLDESRRYPIMTKELLRLYLSLIDGVSPGRQNACSHYLLSIDKETFKHSNDDVVQMEFDSTFTPTIDEVVALSIGTFLYYNTFRLYSDPAIDLRTTRLIALERRKQLDILGEDRLRAIDDLIFAIDSSIVLNDSVDLRIAPTDHYDRIRRRIRELSNTPMDGFQNPIFDERSLPVYKEIKSLAANAKDEFATRMKDCSDPTRCVFLRDRKTGTPRVLSVRDIEFW